MEKGKQEERLRIAQALLDMTEDDALIAAKTGLPIDSVRRLRDAT